MTGVLPPREIARAIRDEEGGQSMKKLAFFPGAAVILFVVGIFGSAGAEEYPLRKEYPKVVPITTENLSQRYKEAIIIDSRNEGEYDVVRILGAKLLVVGKMTEEGLTGIRAKGDARPLVFYCNGITCTKSYKASEKAMGWGFGSVFCYDAGIFAWAKANPDKTEYFGKVLSGEKLSAALSAAAEEFKKVQISSADLLAKQRAGYTLIDIRDPNERSEVPFHLPGTKSMSFDTVIDLINKKSDAVPRQRLLIVDNVGKQGPWLHYYFKENGFRDYFFLKGGLLQWQQDGYGPKGEKR